MFERSDGVLSGPIVRFSEASVRERWICTQQQQQLLEAADNIWRQREEHSPPKTIASSKFFLPDQIHAAGENTYISWLPMKITNQQKRMRRIFCILHKRRLQGKNFACTYISGDCGNKTLFFAIRGILWNDVLCCTIFIVKGANSY